MYKIYADNQLIYSGRLQDRSINEGKISLEVGKSGSFVFSMFPTNAYYTTIQKLKTIIRVERDGIQIFRGRVINEMDGFYQDKTFTCEGELSFLLDSIQRPFSTYDSPADIFTTFITNHNSQVEEAKRFVVGSVTAAGASTDVLWSNDTYEDTMTNLGHLIESFGGVLHVTLNNQGKSVLNWWDNLPVTENAQAIEFGENLLEFTKETSVDEIATALIPLGAKYNTEIDGADVVRHVTIESVNSGLDYIYDQTAVDTYGWIFRTEVFEDMIDPSALKTVGTARLEQLVNPSYIFELTALDMSRLDKDISAFRLGDYVHIISSPHGLEAWYQIMEQEIDLLYPENDTILLNGTYQTLSLVSLMNAYNAMATKDQLSTMETKERGKELHSWIELTLDSGFHAYDSTDAYKPKYQKINDVVYIRGIVSPTTGTHSPPVSPLTIATGLPEALRPSYDMSFLCPGSDNNRWVCTVTTSGTITLFNFSNSEGMPLTEKLTFVICYSL